LKRSLLLALGWLSVSIGIIGVVIPILPTTPFLLLSGYLFAGQSAKCEAWLVSSKIYKRYALPYKEQQGLTLKKKAEILGLTYVILLISGLIVSHLHVRLVLIVVAIIKLIVLTRIPTIKQEKVIS